MSDLLRSVGERDAVPPIRHGSHDAAMQPAGLNPPRKQGPGIGDSTARTVASTDLQFGAGVKVPTRDFR